MPPTCLSQDILFGTSRHQDDVSFGGAGYVQVALKRFTLEPSTLERKILIAPSLCVSTNSHRFPSQVFCWKNYIPEYKSCSKTSPMEVSKQRKKTRPAVQVVFGGIAPHHEDFSSACRSMTSRHPPCGLLVPFQAGTCSATYPEFPTQQKKKRRRIDQHKHTQTRKK